MPNRTPALVSLRDVGVVIRRLRREGGLSHADLARQLGLDEREVERAESPRIGRMYRARKRLLEHLGGYTLDGPYYALRSLDED